MIDRSYDDEQLTVTRLSQDVFCSTRQPQRCFAEAGKSGRERLHAVRMERAAQLLNETDLPVTEITGRVGYREPVQFAKGISPLLRAAAGAVAPRRDPTRVAARARLGDASEAPM